MHQTDENLRQYPSLTRRWSESDDEYFARVSNGPPLPAESRLHGANQSVPWITGYYTNRHGEPYEPPPPYRERDGDLGGDLFRGEILPNHHFNLYPNGGRRDYVTDSSGRRERYIIDGRGERVVWPFPDNVDTSGDDEDSDMVHLESGRIIPRSEWEADHPWEPSSEEPSDDTDDEFYQRRRLPMPRTRTSLYATSERERHDREVARTRTGYSTGARRGRRESHPRHGGQSYDLARERLRHRYHRPGRSSGHH